MKQKRAFNGLHLKVFALLLFLLSLCTGVLIIVFLLIIDRTKEPFSPVTLNILLRATVYGWGMVVSLALVVSYLFSIYLIKIFNHYDAVLLKEATLPAPAATSVPPLAAVATMTPKATFPLPMPIKASPKPVFDNKPQGLIKEVAVIFSSIKNFNKLSITMENAELLAFLNDYMARMTTCVNATNGIVDRVMGDNLMAIWGLKRSMGNSSKGAIDAALLMREALASFNLKRLSRGQPLVKMGCGLGFGSILVGAVGQTNNYTVVGEAVSIAQKLQQLTNDNDIDIIISQSAYQKAGHYYHSRPLDTFTFLLKEGDEQQLYTIDNKRGTMNERLKTTL